MSVTGISVSTDPSSTRSDSLTPWGISEPSPLPNPLRRFIVDRLGDVAVGESPARPGVERGDRLAERRCLRQTDRAGHDRAHDLVPEVIADLPDDLVAEVGARVVHHADDRAHLEIGV